jgi:hypothetical protein
MFVQIWSTALLAVYPFGLGQSEVSISGEDMHSGRIAQDQQIDTQLLFIRNLKRLRDTKKRERKSCFQSFDSLQ